MSSIRWWPEGLLVAAVCAAYANALGASFQFDDWDVIVRDPRVQSLGAWWDAMPGIRPLLKLSYALNHASGFGAVGFHAANVVVHAANGLLVLGIVRQLAARQCLARDSTTWIALVAALVFSLHPVQTEAVTYACGRSASLSAGFSLASVLVWARARHRTIGAGRGGGAQLVSLLFMVLGFAVKESAVVVPVILMLWVATGSGEAGRWRAALRASALHWLALFACLAIALSLPTYRALAATSLTTRSPLENLRVQIHAVEYLLGQLVRIDRLNADPALEVASHLDLPAVLLAIAMLGTVLFALAGLRRSPLAAFAVLWTFIWLVPTNSVLARLDLANDRQWYGAIVGPALIAGLGFDATRRRTRDPGRRALIASVGLAMIVLLGGVATHQRNAVYRDELVFWQDVIRKSPNNARAFNNLGIAKAERCDLDGAADAWRRALALDPELVRAGVNLRLLVDERAGRGGGGYTDGCRGAAPDRPTAPVSPGRPAPPP
jgi:hypothetical protein